jgi:hypothetical protein
MNRQTQNGSRKSATTVAASAPSNTQDIASLFVSALRDPDAHKLHLELLAHQSARLRLAALDAFIKSVIGEGVNSPGFDDERRSDPARRTDALSEQDKAAIYDALLRQLESGPFKSEKLKELHRALTEEGRDVSLVQLRACRAHFTIALTSAIKGAGLTDQVPKDQKKELTARSYTAATALLAVGSADQGLRSKVVEPVRELLQCSTDGALTLVDGLLSSPPLRHRSERHRLDGEFTKP